MGIKRNLSILSLAVPKAVRSNRIPDTMTKLFSRTSIGRLAGNSKGATAIEYGLIAALIAVAAITAMSGLGGQLSSTFNTTSSAMGSAAS